MISRTKSDTQSPSSPSTEESHAIADVLAPPRETLEAPRSPTESAPPPPFEHTASGRSIVKEITQDIAETLPSGIELHRLYRYQLPLAQDFCDLVVLKLNVPESLEYKLSEWRTDISLRHPSTEIFIKRIWVRENLQANLLNQFRGTDVIGPSGIPTIEKMIDRIYGEKPPQATSPRAELAEREDLTAIPFVAIDRPGTLDREDLICGQRLADGRLRLLAAFIDITDEISPGSPWDKFSQKVGSTLYGGKRTISPLGSELASGRASFTCGETRPAWVVECVINPDNLQQENFTVRRGWVKNHADIDPAKPFDPTSEREIGESLSALSEITRILAHRRTSKAKFIRIDGQGAASQIVAETMIHSKHLLAKYLSSSSPTGAIYKVHQRPDTKLLEPHMQQLEALKIPVMPEIFQPRAFREVLSKLERNGSHRAHALTNEILDILLFRSTFSTEPLPHFGLGGIEYLEIKPRAGGIPNQFVLDAIFTNKKPLPQEELAKRAKDLNSKRWTQDERMYTLRFLEMLSARLLDTGHLFFGEVTRVGGNDIHCQVETFEKWGIVREAPQTHLQPGDVVMLQLKGFNPQTMRFEFKVVEPTLPSPPTLP